MSANVLLLLSVAHGDVQHAVVVSCEQVHHEALRAVRLDARHLNVAARLHLVAQLLRERHRLRGEQ